MSRERGTRDDDNRAMRRRAWHHDYRARQFVLITLTTRDRKPLLGRLAGRSDATTGSADEPRLVLSPIGREVAEEWASISIFYPGFIPKALQLMPDHLHGILFVTHDTGLDLGRIVNSFKLGCNRRLRQLSGDATATLWSRGYNDRILYNDIKLETWVAYLRDNPRRLLLKREHPSLFTTRHEIKRAGHTFAALGNLLLLDYPMKLPVQCSRHLSNEEIAKKCKETLAAARNGAVIVSPAISPGEKAIIKAIHAAGFPLILLQHEGLTAFSRPTKTLLDECAAGHLLLLSLGEPSTRHAPITREQCLALNHAAQAISE